MHFFYIDESGCTGADLANVEQPVFVMGGVSIRDEGWNRTQDEFSSLISECFNGSIPNGFEFHASDLLSKDGNGAFENRPLNGRLELARSVLNLLSERSHSVHLFAIKKDVMVTAQCEVDVPYNLKIPYLCAFDYMITYINHHVKRHLGQSARGMVILDRKDEFANDIERITRARRYEGPATYRVKWVVEFSYPVDSRKNPMVQISDLIVFCARRLLEIEHGYRDDYSQELKQYCAECYAKVHDRITRKQLVPRGGRGMQNLDSYLSTVRCEPVGRWKQRYGL